MKVRKFSWSKFLLFLLVLTLLIFLAIIGVYFYEIGPVSSNNKTKLITIEKGDNYYKIGKKLKKENLIKSELFYTIYIKIKSPNSLAAGDYELSEALGVKEIIEILSDSKNQKINTVNITFREGLNIGQIAKIVEEKTEINESEFLEKANDKEYIKSIQTKYWFLRDDIYNEQIYYPLEGYLFPDTYTFEKKKISSETIIEGMLDNTLSKLKDYKDSIENNNYTPHQILTLASLIEQEAVTKEDRKMVSSVFYNRLKIGMSLGSDVTTYYASKKSMKEALTVAELNDCNGYNTRCKTMKGLPVGPINNPSLSAIEAALNPETSDYYYFVADTEKKVYFAKNLNEHNQIIAKLKKEGKWGA